MSASPYRTVVVTPGATIDLTVLATVKDELGITNTTNDGWLQTKITQSSNAIATSCNRLLHQETVADYFSLNWQTCRNNGALVLSRTPVASIVSLVEGNATIDVSNYEYDAETGMVWRNLNNVRGGYWFGGQIVVTYIGGYELLGTLPYDLEQACILLVKGSWFSKTRDPLIKSVSIPDVASYDYWVGGAGGGQRAAFPPEVENLVAPYRRPGAV